jgi:SAM-dependent methyltransferase
MIKYCATAAALKAFSSSRPAKKMYRSLGNSLGSRKRAVGRMPSFYTTRVERMLELSRTFGVPRDGARILELGTGWLHWEAIATSLFFDVDGVLYDVWDNRQLNGLKNYLRQLAPLLESLDVDSARRSRAKDLMARIETFTEYHQLYELLGFTYVVDEAGVLGAIEKGSFDLVMSAGVLEHVYAKDAQELIRGVSAALKPGGLSVHSINIRDHFYQYDRGVSPKQYLQYPDWMWRLFFENDVQYINRLQRSDWLRIFETAGLALVGEEIDAVDLAGLAIAKTYQQYAEKDLACAGLTIVHRMPVSGSDAIAGGLATGPATRDS